jgi:hypothetical protein
MRTITTSSGTQKVIEVTKACPEHPDVVVRPPRLTPQKRKYGFDIITEIGLLRNLKHRQISDIHDDLIDKGIHIPKRTIENLCQVFQQYLVATHFEDLSKINELIVSKGGYTLHIDTTSTKGNPRLLLIKDSVSGIRLLAASVPSEGSQFIKPHLSIIKSRFGNPIASVRDMGKGIEKAIKETFPDTHVITSHFHFLRVIGNRIFNKNYYRFNNRVNNTGIKKKLRQLRKQFAHRQANEDRDEALKLLDYILEYKKDGNGVGFPFTLEAVNLYRRCEAVRPKVRRSLLKRSDDLVSSPCLSRLENALNLLKPPPAVKGRIHSEYLKLEGRLLWFEKIRKALRYKNGPVPLNTHGSLSDKELQKGSKMMNKLQTEMDEFVRLGKPGNDRSLKRILRGILGLIEERKEELFVPNVIINVDGKQKVWKLPRTNNNAEHEFRRTRRHGRRIRGDNDVERIVQREGIGVIIANNLEIRDYVQTVYGRIDKMAERFAKVSTESLEWAKSAFLPK